MVVLSPDVINGAKESSAVLLAAGDEQVVPQRVEFVSARSKADKNERSILKIRSEGAHDDRNRHDHDVLPGVRSTRAT